MRRCEVTIGGDYVTLQLRDEETSSEIYFENIDELEVTHDLSDQLEKLKIEEGEAFL